MIHSQQPRYLIGIDLGTTHTVVAYADLEDPQASGDINKIPIQLFEIEQLVGPGEVASKALLPSCRFHPARGEVPLHDMQLPWTSYAPQDIAKNKLLAGELDQFIVGQWARELGAKVEGRLVVSAKSWLSHAQVDRSAAILPWAGVDGVEKVSPVVASASYLKHIRCAWNHQHADDLLEHQDITITVPASFDEAARALTVEAAQMAGLGKIRLLEEPQAVVYDWYARNQAQAADLLKGLHLLLVCDVGGGTTDLSLIQVSSKAGELALTRVGVGDHLMLGGDNVDLALAHIAEQRIVGSGKKLKAASFSQLVEQTRCAKERLLSAGAERTGEKTATVTVLGSGSKLIGGARHCELSRQEVMDIALDGFFPLTKFEELPAQRNAAIVEFGLPYASDPAVSKHLAQFLSNHQSVCREALAIGEDQQADAVAIPDAVLFNGGVFNSELLFDRAQKLLSSWSTSQITVLENGHPDLAVAHGAVAYGKARCGAQLKIDGGSARSYFLITETTSQRRVGVCLLPRGSEEGDSVRLSGRRFALRLGQPVQFHLASATLDTRFDAGEVVAVDEAQFVLLPPLVAALDDATEPTKTLSTAASTGKNEVEVELVTTLTEVGTLHIECVRASSNDAVDESENEQRWNVEFQIRKNLAAQQKSLVDEVPLKMASAKQKIELVFGQGKKNANVQAARNLRKDLEKLIAKREQWHTPVLRELYDVFAENYKKRRRSQVHEKTWYNMAGYALRPGFGFPLDDWRCQNVWSLYDQGVQYRKEFQSWSAWWTFWRRVAGGLTQDQQQQIFLDLSQYINPETARNSKLSAELKVRSYEDMVRLAATLEHLAVEQKIELGSWLLSRLEKNTESPSSWWALGRIGSRVPFYGSAHNVVPKDVAHDWLMELYFVDWKKNQNAAFAAVMMARMSGDRERDVEDEARSEISAKLKSIKAPQTWLDMIEGVGDLDAVEMKRMYGEDLPPGLKLLN